MENNTEPRVTKPSFFERDIVKGISIALVLIIFFSAGNLVGNFTSKGGSAPVAEADTTVPASTEATTSAPAVTEAPATQTPASTDAAATTNAPAATNAPADTTAAPSGGAQAGAPQSKAEVLKLFNDSANKIKTGASKVTRNYEDLQNVPEELNVPALLKGVANPLLNQFLKKDETPLEWSGADITANYPLKGENVVSKLTEADITDATCTDDGTTYNVTIKIVTATDPTTSGPANALTLISPDDVKNNAKVVSEFSCDYHDGVIEAKIDKATGNMTWAKYTNPMTLKVKAMGVDAQVGMIFVDDYTIAY